MHISVDSADIWDTIFNNFKLENKKVGEPDINLTIEKGYGKPFVNYNVRITNVSKKIFFQRADYIIESDLDFRNASIKAHNNLALKHALTNLYSSFIVYHNWGLLIHSSCAMDNSKAHLFAGQSGAGKSTVARLSQPRELLSDEATLVKITPEEIAVFNSPFRSEIKATDFEESVPLASIQLLHQDLQNNKVNLRKADALLNLMDKVFYWAHSPEETKKIMALLIMLVEHVPAYDLRFKKDDTFWELIS